MSKNERIAWVISVIVGYVSFELALHILGKRK